MNLVAGNHGDVTQGCLHCLQRVGAAQAHDLLAGVTRQHFRLAIFSLGLHASMTKLQNAMIMMLFC
jgi:hypothetical protein